jgi:hypothetical protein
MPDFPRKYIFIRNLHGNYSLLRTPRLPGGGEERCCVLVRLPARATGVPHHFAAKVVVCPLTAGANENRERLMEVTNVQVHSPRYGHIGTTLPSLERKRNGE